MNDINRPTEFQEAMIYSILSIQSELIVLADDK